MSPLCLCVSIAFLSVMAAGAGRWTMVNRTRTWRGFVAPGAPPYAQSPTSAFTFTMWVYLDPWNQLLSPSASAYLSLFNVRTPTTPSDDSRLPAVYLVLPNRLHVSTNWAGSNYGAITPAAVQAAGFGQWMFLAVVIDNTAAQELALYYAANATAALTLLPGNTNGQALPLRPSAVFSTDVAIQTALVVLHNVTLYDRALSVAELNVTRSSTAPPPMPFSSGQPSQRVSGNLAGGFAYDWLPNAPDVPEPAPATNGLLTVSCPVSGSRVTRVLFASYGTPQGDFPSFTVGTVHATASLAIVQQRCLSRASCTLQANGTTFAPDPAPGVRKWLAVVVQCNQTLTSTTTTTSPKTRRRSTPDPRTTSRRATTAVMRSGTRPGTRQAIVPTQQAGRKAASSRKPVPTTNNAPVSTSRVSRRVAPSTTALGRGPRPGPAPTGGTASSGAGSWLLPSSAIIVALGGCAAGLILAIVIACCMRRRKREPAASNPQALYTNPHPMPIALHVPSASALYFTPASLSMIGTPGPSSGYTAPAHSLPQRPATASMRRSRREEARDKFGQGAHTMTMSSGESTVDD